MPRLRTRRLAISQRHDELPMQSVRPQRVPQGINPRRGNTKHPGVSMTVPLNKNGHKRRELRKRVLAEETHCALCDQPVDKKLKTTPGGHYKKCHTPICTGCLPHPMRAEVDEIVPRAKGGSPLSRENCQLTHRKCNQLRGIKSVEEARAIIAGIKPERTVPPVQASPIW